MIYKNLRFFSYLLLLLAVSACGNNTEAKKKMADFDADYQAAKIAAENNLKAAKGASNDDIQNDPKLKEIEENVRAKCMSQYKKAENCKDIKVYRSVDGTGYYVEHNVVPIK